MKLGGGCRLAWSRLGDSGSLDPGSNPGSPIRKPFCFLCVVGVLVLGWFWWRGKEAGLLGLIIVLGL